MLTQIILILMFDFRQFFPEVVPYLIPCQHAMATAVAVATTVAAANAANLIGGIILTWHADLRGVDVSRVFCECGVPLLGLLISARVRASL